MNFTSLVDVGVQAEDFFTKLQRLAGETIPDWCARFEKREAELLAQLKVLNNSVTEVIAKPLRTWCFLFAEVPTDTDHSGRDLRRGGRQPQL